MGLKDDLAAELHKAAARDPARTLLETAASGCLVVLGEDHKKGVPQKAALLASMIRLAQREPNVGRSYLLHAFENLPTQFQEKLDTWLYRPDVSPEVAGELQKRLARAAMAPTDIPASPVTDYRQVFYALRLSTTRRTCVIAADYDSNAVKQETDALRQSNTLQAFSAFLDNRDRHLWDSFQGSTRFHDLYMAGAYPKLGLPLPVEAYLVSRRPTGSGLVGMFHAQRVRGSRLLKGKTFAQLASERAKVHSALVVTSDDSETRVAGLDGSDEFVLSDAFAGLNPTHFLINRKSLFAHLTRRKYQLKDKTLMWDKSIAQMFHSVVWLA